MIKVPYPAASGAMWRKRARVIARPTVDYSLDAIKKSDAPMATPSVRECTQSAIVVRNAELMFFY